jgi:hypothetical protein
MPRRVAALLAAFGLLLGAATARAQEWSLYPAFDDFFSIDFPGEPTIRQSTYQTQYGFTLPARVYTARDEFGTYSVTAVNWSTVEAQHAAAYKQCIAATGDLRGGDNPGICNESRTRGEIAGAALHAGSGLIRRGGKVLELAFNSADRVDAVRVEMINADQSQTVAMIAWHEGFLYVAEGTAPKGAPPPSAFPISLQFLDKEGRRIQYDGSRYTPGWPVPKRSR